MNDRQFEFLFDTPFAYMHKGEAKEARSLLLTAPSAKNKYEAAALKKGIYDAIRNMTEQFKGEVQQSVDKEPSSDDDLTAAQMYDMLMMYGDIDVNPYFETFKKLMLAKKICLIDGVEQMEDGVYDTLDFREVERLIGEYLYHFLAPSQATMGSGKS